MTKDIKILIGLIVVLVIVYSALIYFNFRNDSHVIDDNPIDVNVDDGAEIGIDVDDIVIINQERNTPEGLIDHINTDLKDADNEEKAIFFSKGLSGHGYESMIIKYKFSKGENIISVFRGSEDVPKYVVFNDGVAEILPYGWSFNELFQTEESRLDIKITDYAMFELDLDNLTPAEWIKREN
jgi:hypothetical protein